MSEPEFAPAGPCHFRTIWWCWIANDPFQPLPDGEDYRCPLCDAKTPTRVDNNGLVTHLEVGWLSIHRLRASMSIWRTIAYKDQATTEVTIAESAGYWRREGST